MTLPLTPGLRIYLAPGATDIRKSFRGLMAATREVLQEDPLSVHLFGFCNRRRTLIKLLLWDTTGFWSSRAHRDTSVGRSAARPFLGAPPTCGCAGSTPT